MAARPRTLPAAIAPVLVGTAAAVQWAGELPRVGAFIAALIGSVFIQIGTNLANDYSDARRGADTVDRLGPVRVTSPGLVTPRRVLVATWVAFGVAVLCGIYLAAVAGIVILLVGAVSIAAGVLYTGGPRPYGYAGLGEVFVFLFFGLVAVNGSYYVQVENAPGAAARALDCGRVSGDRDPRRQQRPRLGDRSPRGQETAGGADGASQRGRPVPVARARRLSSLLPLALIGGEASLLPLIGLAALPMAIGPLRAMRGRTDGPALNAALGRDRRAAGRLQPAGLGGSADLQLSTPRELRCCRCAHRLGRGDPLCAPLPRAIRDRPGRLERREMVLLRLRCEEGLSGLGEAVPLSLRGGTRARPGGRGAGATRVSSTRFDEARCLRGRRNVGAGALRCTDCPDGPARTKRWLLESPSPSSARHRCPCAAMRP